MSRVDLSCVVLVGHVEVPRWCRGWVDERVLGRDALVSCPSPARHDRAYQSRKRRCLETLEGGWKLALGRCPAVLDRSRRWSHLLIKVEAKEVDSGRRVVSPRIRRAKYWFWISCLNPSEPPNNSSSRAGVLKSPNVRLGRHVWAGKGDMEPWCSWFLSLKACRLVVE